jgi:hypothetical protein
MWQNFQNSFHQQIIANDYHFKLQKDRIELNKHMVEEALAGFSIEAELARIQEEPVIESVKNFLEVEAPFSMRVTTAQ